jgi:hypothetical protein
VVSLTDVVKSFKLYKKYIHIMNCILSSIIFTRITFMTPMPVLFLWLLVWSNLKKELLKMSLIPTQSVNSVYQDCLTNFRIIHKDYRNAYKVGTTGTRPGVYAQAAFLLFWPGARPGYTLCRGLALLYAAAWIYSMPWPGYTPCRGMRHHYWRLWSHGKRALTKKIRDHPIQ